MSIDRFNETSENEYNAKDEPSVENNYENHPEIEQPNPSIATPSIPSEMPPR